MIIMENFKIEKTALTKYLFFTGKGGVGKTSTACATAVSLADSGKKVMLISTDPASNLQLLPRLRNQEETEVIIVTLAETTPVYEALRLEEDLKRAGIATKWWIINSSLYRTGTTNKLLLAKARNEIEWINKVHEHADGNFAVIEWKTH